MGEGKVELSSLTLDKLTELVIELAEEKNTSEELGQLVLGVRLVPKSDGSDFSTIGALVKGTTGAHHHGQSSQMVSSASLTKDMGSSEAAKFGGKRSLWSATVNIILVQGQGLQAMDEEGTSDPYCKVR